MYSLKDQSNEFKEVSNIYYKLSKDISELKVNLQNKQEELKFYENKLHSLCNHEWVMDTPEYQTPTSWTCSICRKYK